jgi:hypothetical protein
MVSETGPNACQIWAEQKRTKTILNFSIFNIFNTVNMQNPNICDAFLLVMKCSTWRILCKQIVAAVILPVGSTEKPQKNT